jgi:bifunctional non-homologous end joining protein LigD
MSKKSRTGKIFVDYLRNGEGATAIAPYAVRARPGSPVAMPISWSELHDVKASEFTVRTVPGILKGRKRDPWQRYFDLEQRVPAALAEQRKAKRAG